jgi:hypothetical protein
MGLAKEGQHMVLAQRVELDVAHHDHVVVFFLEDSFPYYFLGARGIAFRQELHRLGDALRSL